MGLDIQGCTKHTTIAEKHTPPPQSNGGTPVILNVLYSFPVAQTRTASIGRGKVTLTAVPGTSVMATILSKICRFGIPPNNIPKTKAECESSERLEAPRKIRVARALMSEIVDLALEHAHSDPNYRLRETVEVTL